MVINIKKKRCIGMQGKKGSLELSINSIVIIIIAITMLGLGLTFMKGAFGNVVKQLGFVSAEVQKDMETRFAGNTQRVDVWATKLDISKGGQGENYLGINNVLNEDVEFTIDTATCKPVTGTSCAGLSVPMSAAYRKQKIGHGTVKVLPFSVKTTSNIGLDTYQIEISVHGCETALTPCMNETVTFYANVK
jgi:hypothetical protein